MTQWGANNSCISCRFWESKTNKLGPVGSLGECRRYPPKVFAILLKDQDREDRWISDTHWPDTFDDEWCGEYQVDMDRRFDAGRTTTGD